RDLGHQYSGWLGFRDYRLRVVDRHRPRGNAHFRILIVDAPGVADVDQPAGGGDDDLRRDDGRFVSAAAFGPAVVLLLALALSGHDGPVAAVSQRARVGRVRGEHLFFGVVVVLVHGDDPGFCQAARPRADAAEAWHLRRAGD